MDWPLTNPVLIFATVMLIVLLAPPLFERLGMPGLVGLIVSGAVVGPNALGMLQRGATFELLGTVGLLYLMFMAGLSLDLDQFVRYKTRSLTFGILSFLFPAGLAFLVGTRLLAYEPPTALLLGAVVGSHTLLAYPVAARLGITDNPAVTMTMGGTRAMPRSFDRGWPCITHTRRTWTRRGSSWALVRRDAAFHAQVVRCTSSSSYSAASPSLRRRTSSTFPWPRPSFDPTTLWTHCLRAKKPKKSVTYCPVISTNTRRLSTRERNDEPRSLDSGRQVKNPALPGGASEGALTLCY